MVVRVHCKIAGRAFGAVSGDDGTRRQQRVVLSVTGVRGGGRLDTRETPLPKDGKDGRAAG